MNRTIFRKLMVVTIIVVFIFLILWVLTRPQVLNLGVTTEEKPDFVFENPIIVENNSGMKTWQIQALKGEFYKKNQVAFMINVTANIITQNNPYILLNAPKAKIDLKNNKVTFYNSFLRQLSGDISLKVDEMTWFYDKYLIKGRGNVKLLRNNVTVDADSFEVFINENKFILKNRPKLQFSY
ncbi:MAG: LPS export ABC transporter periplasmic protein LptC [Candidatus Margulisbacteria bacterium GWF2_38_17]|nr:MAG: LPS export ABC transporter periplasmic protein LptC [Candidatus Margulisbacteria bacterium GWD2_39_127]OGI01031.1 MAG: LPS export ABC transporter periplasmic protein LptC [Candidatus Margulisbacteria bacterium GWF2_38_17]OGI09560.1 MAG: LPS export ABC transporter periplasmic protein LptC [Candidatus Margulisbacteria bacterium GWE2_39_32]